MFQEKIENAIESLRLIILDGRTSGAQIREIEKMIWQLRQMLQIYLYTLDSHDCYGPFETKDAAMQWANDTGKSSYQLVENPPYELSRVIKPH